MQAPSQRRKKRGKLYFSSNKALKTSRMGRKKVAPEKYDTKGINKILDFEAIVENDTLSRGNEFLGPTNTKETATQSGGASTNMGTQSNPASNTAMEEHSAEEELDETSLLEPEGKFLEPYTPLLCSNVEEVGNDKSLGGGIFRGSLLCIRFIECGTNFPPQDGLCVGYSG